MMRIILSVACTFVICFGFKSNTKSELDSPVLQEVGVRRSPQRARQSDERISATGDVYRSTRTVASECGRADLALVEASEHVTIPATTRVYFGQNCGSSCDVSTDLECLPAERCLPLDDHRNRCNVAFAREVRSGIRARTNWKNDHIQNIPIGKMLNYHTIDNWNAWVKKGEMASKLLDTGHHVWIRRNFSDTIPFCKSRGFEPLDCFLKPLEAEETDNDAVERVAVAEVSFHDGDQLIKNVLRCQQATACGNAAARLLLFAQLTRMRFVREAPLIDYHDASVVELNHGAVGHLNVALHMRRGDACFKGVLDRPSELSDPWQPSSSRYCYSTAVYVAKLRRLRQMYKGLGTVYLSTDDPVDHVLADFKNVAPDIFRELNWRYLNVSRAAYTALPTHAMVENLPLSEKPQVALDSLADLWHMSHGDFYVGHLGSKYGKQAWFLAMGRKGRFVPYVSVDGHTACCTTEESCANAMKLVHDVDACITYKQGLRPGLTAEAQQR